MVRVQYKRGTSTTTTITVTLDSAPTNGNLLFAVIAIDYYAGTARIVSSISQTNVTWSKLKSQAGALYTDAEIWGGVVGANASATITITISGSHLGAVANVCEYNNLLTSDFVDKTASATGTGTSAVTGTTAQTTQADEVWIGGICGDYASQSNPTNGFTLLDGALFNGTTSCAYLEKFVSATGQASSGTTLSATEEYAGCIITVKAAGAVLKTVTDALSLSDTVFRNKPSLTITDSLAAADAIKRDKTFAVTDAIGASDTALRNKPSLTITDSVGLADALKRDKTFTIADVLGLADVILLNKTLAISDNVGASDVALGNKAPLIVSDSISLADFVNVITGAIIKTVLDSIGLADVVYTPSRVLQTLDSVGLTDNIIVNKVLQITETINLVETIQVGVGGIKKTKLFLIMGDLAVQLTGS